MNRALSVIPLLALAGCAAEWPAPPEAVRVYAAASLASALGEIAARHEARTGIPATINFAASSILAKQIDAGAPADVFLSANPAWTDWLQERGRLAEGSTRELLGNSLALVAPAAAPFAFDPRGSRSLAGAFEGRLALGDPAHVPAGVYARQALEAAGWWRELEARTVPALDARAALALVERGECAAGIVYASDAAGSARVHPVAAIPEKWHEPIVYTAAIVTGRDRPAVSAFLETLRSAEAGAIFRAHGFRLPTGARAGA